MAGGFDRAKGRAKEAAGSLTDDKDLKAEGKTDKVAGRLKDVVDGAKEKIQGVLGDKGDRASRN
jgi:uncharacterized protein YjbJ (UPF0337 family)